MSAAARNDNIKYISLDLKTGPRCSARHISHVGRRGKQRISTRNDGFPPRKRVQEIGIRIGRAPVSVMRSGPVLQVSFFFYFSNGLILTSRAARPIACVRIVLEQRLSPCNADVIPIVFSSSISNIVFETVIDSAVTTCWVTTTLCARPGHRVVII